MTPYERVFARLSGKPVDRIPNLNILMAFAAKYIGVSYDKYCTDYRLLVDANIKCNEQFGIDMLSTMSDPLRETSDFGAKVIFNYDAQPRCQEDFIKEHQDVKKLKFFDPNKSKRMYDRIQAIELYKKETGNNNCILGWVEGSFAEACDLRGINDAMVDIYEEPEFLNEIMEICCQQGIVCAKEQIKAGADFIGIGDAAASLISPALYKEMVLPYEIRMIEEIHKAGAKVKLHICGNISNLLDAMKDTKADIIDVDWMVDFKTAITKLDDHCCVNGNYDPVRVMYQGTADLIESEVRRRMDIGKDSRCFISAGCEIPRDTPVENLKLVYAILSSK